MGLPPPSIDESSERVPYKIIDSTKVKKQLGYRFIYPDISAVLTLPGAFADPSVNDCTSP